MGERLPLMPWVWDSAGGEVGWGDVDGAGAEDEGGGVVAVDALLFDVDAVGEVVFDEFGAVGVDDPVPLQAGLGVFGEFADGVTGWVGGEHFDGEHGCAGEPGVFVGDGDDDDVWSELVIEWFPSDPAGDFGLRFDCVVQHAVQPVHDPLVDDGRERAHDQRPVDVFAPDVGSERFVVVPGHGDAVAGLNVAYLEVHLVHSTPLDQLRPTVRVGSDTGWIGWRSDG